MSHPELYGPAISPDLQIAEPPPHISKILLSEVTPHEFREALSRAATPVTIVATDGPNGVAGVTCSAVCSVSDTPPTILVCINRKSFANGVIKANGVLSVNWLSADQSGVSQLFAGAGGLSMPERFASAEWETRTTGAPHCKDALMSLDCQLIGSMEMGTHTVLFARVLAVVQATPRDPLVYYQRSYATTQPTKP